MTRRLVTSRHSLLLNPYQHTPRRLLLHRPRVSARPPHAKPPRPRESRARLSLFTRRYLSEPTISMRSPSTNFPSYHTYTRQAATWSVESH